MAVPIWVLLVLKDFFIKRSIPGGPEFGPVSGLPVTVALSSTMFVALGAYQDFDFSSLLTEALFYRRPS